MKLLIIFLVVLSIKASSLGNIVALHGGGEVPSSFRQSVLKQFNLVGEDWLTTPSGPISNYYGGKLWIPDVGKDKGASTTDPAIADDSIRII